MYGYSFGAAAADVWHKTDYTAMLYPSYMPYTVAGALVYLLSIFVVHLQGKYLMVNLVEACIRRLFADLVSCVWSRRAECAALWAAV